MNNNLVILSPFTPKNNIVGSSGGGMSYNTYNTIQGLLGLDVNNKITLLAEKDVRFKPREKLGRLQIIRCWERDRSWLWISLLKNLNKLKTKQINRNIIIEFEFAAYGNFISTGFFPIFLLFSGLFGFKPIVVIHQVLLNLEELGAHLGIRNKLVLRIFSLMLVVYYFLIVNLSKNSIVLEEVLAERLKKLSINKSKIRAIPHGLIKNRDLRLPASFYKNQLGYNTDEFIIVLFGYITWYKGSDWLIEAVKYYNNSRDKKIRLILAGGESSTQRYKEHYQKYFRSIIKSATDKHIEITGYLNDSDIERFIKLADLMVFPYRVLMSSSGPLSWALAYGKPYIISEKLKGYLQTKDAEEIFKGYESNLIFKLDYESFAKNIDRIISNTTELNKLANLSERLGDARDWSVIAQEYSKLLSD